MHLQVVNRSLYSTGNVNRLTDGEPMSQSSAAANTNEEIRANRPAATFRQGGMEVNVWKNLTQNGEMYNTTIRNSYKDDKGEWKETDNFSPADLAVLAQLSGQAFREIVEMKAQSRGR